MLALGLFTLALAANASLGIGDKAPPLKVGSYVKGIPVSLKKGVHVVEFWATWCGPCRMSIPHLTELAKAYKGKVDFTGVSISEQGPDQLGQVKKFVKDMGKSMAYNVAIDTDSKFMSKNWMDAAGQDGIPTAFIVRDGVVLWIGHPMMGLSETLGKVTAGKFSVAQSKKEFAQAAAIQKAQQEEQNAVQPYVEARQSGDLDAALKAIGVASKKYPNLAVALAPSKAEILIIQGSKDGYAMAETLTTGMYKDNPQVLNLFAWAIVEPTPAAKDPDYQVALKYSKRAVDVTKSTDPAVMDTYARALFKSGDKAGAVEWETKAIGLLKGADAATVKSYQDSLNEYKKG